MDGSDDQHSAAGRRPALLGDAARFVVVGVFNTLIGYGGYCLLVFLGLHYALAATLAWIVAASHSYLLNKAWTFRDHRAHAPRTLAAFVSSNLLALGVNLGALAALVDGAGWNPYLANLVAIAGSTAVNFAACRYWVFRG